MLKSAMTGTVLMETDVPVSARLKRGGNATEDGVRRVHVIRYAGTASS